MSPLSSESPCIDIARQEHELSIEDRGQAHDKHFDKQTSNKVKLGPKGGSTGPARSLALAPFVMKDEPIQLNHSVVILYTECPLKLHADQRIVSASIVNQWDL